MSDTTYAPHLPDAVRRASELADQLSRAASQEARGEPVEPEAGDNSGNNGAGDQSTTEVNQGSQLELPGVDKSQFGHTQPATPATPATTVDWEQRYNTLQGKYNQEVPELRGELRSLRELIAAMQHAPARAEPAPVANIPPPGAREIPPEDIETYGPDLVAAAQRWAEAKFAPVLQDFERRLLAAEGGTAQVRTQSATQSVAHALDRAVPEWQEVNVRPEFITWLAQVDPFSGQRRKDLITHAYGSGDANRTIAFFRAFLNEQHTVTATPPAAGTRLIQTSGNGADQPSLADLAVPGRGASSSAQQAPGADGTKRIWRTGEITAFYREKSRGLWANREADAARIEQEIFAAGAEGRVRQ